MPGFKSTWNQTSPRPARRHSSFQEKELYKEPYFLLENTSFSYEEGLNTLNEVNLKIYPGDILFVTGNSGAGKTTLLKLLAYELKAKKGRLIRPSLKEVSLGQVHQDLKLIPNWSIQENLSLARSKHIYPRQEQFDQDMFQLGEYLGIKKQLNRKLNQANGGLKQKVAVLRALLGRPDVLIADEPTAAMDLESAKRIFDLFNLFNQKNKMTVIWATHNRELVSQFNGRNIHLTAGKMVYQGRGCLI